ncbi:putative oxidoreductase [Streptomyces avermitilis MA-4680 = NBRC 14893]|uniref:Oxidoreductase n=1 Tax=Streptomyces avermitilis (strain ATCC 31267 / DSM 46492 / JCM 5070 / NBRC 14893 / NCIMB 12804 / NRRL 8165 / MA-4680) TaxID=227882 RepID=Q82MW5_STRAW|nr:putative oxidoreductase [Streptomyces avermitilis MA-4680 = NBRC 14893]
MTTTTQGAARATGAVGTAHTRVEGRDKVTGAARYAGEIPYDELAHGWLVLSTVARGRVRTVESDPVLAMPGVLAVLHHANAPRVTTDYIGIVGRPDPALGIFQDDRVPYVGWPVALVVAETSEQAREAAEALVVRYDEEPHDVEFFAGHPGLYTPQDSPLVQAEAVKGDVEAELAASDVVVDAEYATPGGVPLPAGAARGDGPLGQRPARRRRLQPEHRVGGRRAGPAVLPRPGLGAGAVGARGRRLRVQGGAPAPGGRRHGRNGSAPPRQSRTDPSADVLAGRLPQPHGAADQARCRPRRAAAGLRPPGAEPHVDRARVRRVERRPRPCAVRRRRAPHHSSPRTARRADPDLDACAGRGAGLVRAGVGARRTRGEVRPGPDRPARAQRTRGGPCVRAAVQQPQCARLLRGGRPQVRLGGPRSASRRAPRGALAARDRYGGRHVPLGGRPVHGGGDRGGGRHLHRADQRGGHRDRSTDRADPDRRGGAGRRAGTRPRAHRGQRPRSGDVRRRLDGHPLLGLGGDGRGGRAAGAAGPGRRHSAGGDHRTVGHHRGRRRPREEGTALLRSAVRRGRGRHHHRRGTRTADARHLRRGPDRQPAHRAQPVPRRHGLGSVHGAARGGRQGPFLGRPRRRRLRGLPLRRERRRPSARGGLGGGPRPGRPGRDQGHRRDRRGRWRGGDRQRGLARDRRTPPAAPDQARPCPAGGGGIQECLTSPRS